MIRFRKGYSLIYITLGIAVLILFIIIHNKQYPEFVQTFSQKASVFFGFHNNELASVSLEKAQDTESSGLEGKSDYYIDWAKKFNPNDKVVLAKIAEYYYLKEDFEQSLEWYKKALKEEPNDRYYKSAIAKCLYYTNIEEAVLFAESLIEDYPDNQFAACILRDYYNQKSNNELAFYWGLRAFYYKANEQDEHDLDVFGEILSNKICSTEYQSHDNTLIISYSTVDQPIIGLSNKRYKEGILRAQDDKAIALFMHNRIDIGISEDSYYFIHIPGYPAGEIWHSDKLKRNLKSLLQDHPNVVISSLIVVN